MPARLGRFSRHRPIEPIADSFRCEVLVIGAGITGALVAERLTRQGRQVIIIDREIQR